MAVVNTILRWSCEAILERFFKVLWLSVSQVLSGVCHSLVAAEKKDFLKETWMQSRRRIWSVFPVSNFIGKEKRDSTTGVFLWILRIFKNINFLEHLQTTASNQIAFFSDRKLKKSDWNRYALQICRFGMFSVSILK